MESIMSELEKVMINKTTSVTGFIQQITDEEFVKIVAKLGDLHRLSEKIIAASE